MATAPFVVPTKVRPPVLRSGIVARARLTETLDRSLTKPAGVALVCAPAGWGKTTLVRSWLDDAEIPVAWFQLDEGDNDPARFSAHLLAAIASAVGERWRADLTRYPSDRLDAVVDGLIASLDAIEGLVVVFDDYHVITTAAIHDALDRLVHWLPGHAHVTMCTRAEPPLIGLSRLRASGQLVELRAAELAFSIDETRSLFSASVSSELSDRAVTDLLSRTEGWVAGLHLAALSMNRPGDIEAFVAGFAGDDRLVADYLRSELIDSQPSEVRRFLVATSILDELSGPLCDAVLETKGSTARLRELERSNLFLVPLDTTGELYRYHHLLSDWLRAELADQPEWSGELHQRAAAWLDANSSPEAALRHAFAAGDRQMAGQVVATHWREALAVGRDVTVLDWFDRLGDEVVGSDASLCVARAQVGLNIGDPADVVSHWMHRAEELADPQDQTMVGQLHRNLGIQLRMNGDLVGAERHARRAVDLLSDEPLASEAEALLGGVLALSGDYIEAIEHLSAGTQTTAAENDQLSLQFGLAYRALAEYELGRLSLARETADRALRLAQATDLEDSPTLICARLVLAALAIDDDELGTAGEHITWALAAARAARSTVCVYLALLASARLASHRKHGAEARRLLGEARTVLATMPAPGRLASLVDVAERQLRSGGRTQVVADVDLAVVEDLTERELAVLRLLPSELTVREIGGELFVSHNTVKGHIKAIYRKLGVTSRQSCVARARSIGVL